MSRKKFFAVLISGLLAFATLDMSQATATPSTLTLTLKQTPSASEPIVTMYGQIKPAKVGLKISVQVELDKSWQTTDLTAKTTSGGAWKVEALATALSASVKYRVFTKVGTQSVYSVARSIVIKQIPEIANVDPASLIDLAGPGGRIHGVDISRWQHPNDRTIDFAKMYSAGVRFVMIKAADSKDISDAQALKYLVMDHNAAQAAGLFTGFYYYTTLPDSTDPNVIVNDAMAQAQKAIWRLASIGGYSDRDLSFALDLENNCVRVSSTGKCTKYAARSDVTLWATTWLSVLNLRTGRTPIFYSYPQFLENAMTRSAELNKYPLWMAHYGINPADPLAQPGQKNGGCFVHSWTLANCSVTWSMWQYTSCGIAGKYGVPGGRLDLNVFRGTPNTFLDLVKGTWVPEVADLMPVQEPSTTTINSFSASTTNKPAIFDVSVNRPTGNPVVTGTVSFVPEVPFNPPAPLTQTAVRGSSGNWVLTVKGIPAGTWNGSVSFKDSSGTHAKSSSPVTLTITQGAIPTPKPSASPTPKPTISPAPVVDPCKNQIKN